MNSHRLSIVFRLLAFGLVGFCFVNGRPPAVAQGARDAVQDQQISQLDQKISSHETTDDARVQQLGRDLQAISNQVSEMRGEERGIFGALAVLQILAMVFQFRKDRK